MNTPMNGVPGPAPEVAAAAPSGTLATPCLVPATDGQVLEMRQMFAVRIAPQKGGPFMKELAASVPLQGLHHLKRVRREEAAGGGGPQLCVLLCPVPEGGAAAAPAAAAAAAGDGLPEAASRLLAKHELSTVVVSVPRDAPATKELWVEWNAVWPVAFHPVSDSLLRPPEPLCDSEVVAMRRGIQAAQEQAAYGAALGLPSNGAVIVDPASGDVMAAGHDNSAAPRAGAGSGAARCGCNPLKHAVITALDAAARRDLALHPAPTAAAVAAIAPPPGAGASVEELAGGKRKRDGVLSTDAAERPYLCTGWDCYVVWEPCVMCAMALVHSRVRRVIYANASADGGALGSKMRLHGVRSLNHRYEVYRMMPEGCSSGTAV